MTHSVNGVTALRMTKGGPLLTLASSNRHKLIEFQLIFSKFGIVVTGLPEGLKLDPPEEIGQTFVENADLKAEFYSQHLDGLILSDDSGLCVDALGGQPGIHSARFSGTQATDESNVLKLLDCLHPYDNPDSRTAHFTCVLSLASQGTILHRSMGLVSGFIIPERRGPKGFGYDPVFFYPPLQKTFAEISAAEKCQLSHRFKACEAMAAFITKAF